MPKKSTKKTSPSAKATTKAKPKPKRLQSKAVETTITAATIAGWCDVSVKEVLAFGAETGLPISNTTLVSTLIKSLYLLRERLKPTAADASYTSDEGLICTTYEEAAKAIRARLGVGCVKSLQSWATQGMPCKPGHGVSRKGFFPIDQMEAWARTNLSLGMKDDDPASAARKARLEEEKIRNLVLKNEAVEQKNKAKSGELLPRDVYVSAFTEALATLSNGLMDLPLVMMRGGFVPKERQLEFQEKSQNSIRNLLDDLSTALTRSPEKT